MWTYLTTSPDTSRILPDTQSASSTVLQISRSMYMRVLGVAIRPSHAHWTAWGSLHKYRDNPDSHRRDGRFNVPLPQLGLPPGVGNLQVGQASGTDSIGVLLPEGKGRVHRPESCLSPCTPSRIGGLRAWTHGCVRGVSGYRRG